MRRRRHRSVVAAGAGWLVLQRTVLGDPCTAAGPVPIDPGRGETKHDHDQARRAAGDQRRDKPGPPSAASRRSATSVRAGDPDTRSAAAWPLLASWHGHRCGHGRGRGKDPAAMTSVSPLETHVQPRMLRRIAPRSGCSSSRRWSPSGCSATNRSARSRACSSSRPCTAVGRCSSARWRAGPDGAGLPSSCSRSPMAGSRRVCSPRCCSAPATTAGTRARRLPRAAWRRRVPGRQRPGHAHGLEHQRPNRAHGGAGARPRH